MCIRDRSKTKNGRLESLSHCSRHFGTLDKNGLMRSYEQQHCRQCILFTVESAASQKNMHACSKILQVMLPVNKGSKTSSTHVFGIPDPHFAYSVYNFYGDTKTLKGHLQVSLLSQVLA